MTPDAFLQPQTLPTWGLLILVLSAIVGPFLSYRAASRAPRKQPEDFETANLKNAEFIRRMVRNELDECLKARDAERLNYEEAKRDFEARIERLRKRVKRLEDQVRALGHEPATGGAD